MVQSLGGAGAPMTTQTWFFLRGLSRESAHWSSFLQCFRHGLPNTEVFCLDLPGTGAYWKHRSPTSVASILDFVRNQYLEIVKDRAPSSPRYLMGLSLGGMVGVHWVCRYPEDFRGLVAVNTSLGGVSPWYQRLTKEGLLLLLRVAFTPDLVQKERRILQFTSRLSTVFDAELVRRIQIARARPVSAVNAVRQLVAAIRCQVPAGSPPVPTLLLNSLGDALVHPDCSWQLHRRWGTPLRTHEWAGHELPLDDPQWILDTVRAWMMEHQFDTPLVP